MDRHQPLVFRLHEGGPRPVREVLLELGWKEYNEREQTAGDWNLYWRGSAFRNADYENLLPWQRLNHYPKTVDLTRKDCLARDLRRMKGTYGSSLYNFSPPTFILPKDYTRFVAEYTKHRGGGGGGGGGRLSGYWICKPVDLSRGRGIFIFQDIKDLSYSSSVIVQRYISNPLLVSGYKFDLRIYVGVKSFRPLTVYMYREGLVRFATAKYNLSFLDDPYAHLTNTSINKLSPFYDAYKERVGQGCTWTMSQFRCFLRSQGMDETLLWQRINAIVTLTLLAVAPAVPPVPNCVELFGFDILVDAKLKPWLLEVNYSPALTLDGQVDVAVKKGLIADLIDLMDYRLIDGLRESGYHRQRYARPCYLTSQTAQVPAPPLPHVNPPRSSKRASRRKASHTLPKMACEQHRRISSSQCPHSQSLPLSKAVCQPSSHKRRSHRRSDPHVWPIDHWGYLPPLDLNGTRSARGCIVNKHQIPGLHSRTSTAVNGRTRLALAAHLKDAGASHLSEVAGHDDKDDDEDGDNGDAEVEVEVEVLESSDAWRTPDGSQSGLGSSQQTPPSAACRLPDIHSQTHRPPKPPWVSPRDQRQDRTPPLRVGDFILTFPFNTATLHASQDKLDIKASLNEIQKLIGRQASGCSQPEKKRRRGGVEVKEGGGGRLRSGKEEFESLFWWPKD